MAARKIRGVGNAVKRKTDRWIESLPAWFNILVLLASAIPVSMLFGRLASLKASQDASMEREELILSGHADLAKNFAGSLSAEAMLDHD